MIVKGGKSKGRRLPVKEGERFTFGRGMKADVQLFDEGVSRVHFSLDNRGDDMLLTDLGSANGTYVNGKPLASSSVYNGDEITVGLTVLLVIGVPVEN